ncbi:DUF6684 family protein [Halorientalis brevis]|uniref:DUF6684 family protein n=1 Tax=Halorientalis brevis TaxID=1126241 RepID=A0ABD6CB38_9EURY|nr:DUF6684 family protein [Halorientalis brevis]
MSSKTFDRETLLDLTVNGIPLGIMVFFVIAYAFVNPFGWNDLVSTLQFSIIIVTALLLSILTYFAGKAISEAEAEMEAAE